MAPAGDEVKPERRFVVRAWNGVGERIDRGLCWALTRKDAESLEIQVRGWTARGGVARTKIIEVVPR